MGRLKVYNPSFWKLIHFRQTSEAIQTFIHYAPNYFYAQELQLNFYQVAQQAQTQYFDLVSRVKSACLIKVFENAWRT
jgi:hypothetical protein